jgi:hypothetical protein
MINMTGCITQTLLYVTRESEIFACCDIVGREFLITIILI